MKIAEKLEKIFTRKITTVFLGLVLAAGVAVLLTERPSPSGVTINASLQKYADSVLAKCASADYRPSCYDDEIPKLMDAISMEEAFEVTKLVQAKDSGYFYCHILGHNLSAREENKDPSKWKDVIARCPSGMCSNGCIHGAFQERFRADVLSASEFEKTIPEFSAVCENRPGVNLSGLEQASCYHALGHLLMYVTGADVEKSADTCKKVAMKPDGRNFLQVCYDGVYMQVFQPLEAEDFALVKNITPKKAELTSFCGKYSSDEIQHGSCWNEGWPLYFEEIITPDGLVKHCSALKTADLENRCYDALFFVVAAQFKVDAAKIEKFCSGLPDERMDRCFANAAGRMIETDASLTDRAVNLCEAASKYGAAAQCYDEVILYSTFNFHPGSEESLRLCGLLPEPWRKNCFDKNRI